MGVLQEHFLRKGYPPPSRWGGGRDFLFSLLLPFSFYSKLSILFLGYIPSRHGIHGYLRLEIRSPILSYRPNIRSLVYTLG